TTTATRQPLSPQPPASCSSRAAQPCDSPRARCCYASSILHHISFGPEATRWPQLFGFGSKNKTKTPADLSASSASAEAAAAVAHGLQVVAEGTNPVVNIVAIHGLNGHRKKT
ncbi:hypothetical protein CC86DRAFT_183434, partial [Ophiobolus disseminans]